MGGDSGMNWAVQTKLAILTMLLLSKNGKISLHELASELNQNPESVEKLLSELEDQQWIDQGDKAAIRLTAEPERVSLYQVMEATGRPDNLEQENARVTRLHQTLEDLGKGYFSSVTLDELMKA
jgi:DNA-binding IscR family transcriptional regulator